MMKKVSDKSTIKLVNDFQALNIRGIIKNTDYEVFTDNPQSPRGIWIKDAYFNFLYTRDQDFLDDFYQTMTDDFFGFSGTTIEVYDYFKQREVIQWKNTCNQYHYPGDKFDVPPLDSLQLADAEYVDNHYEYQNDDSLGKIKEAILKRPTSCIRIEGVLVSFVLLHDDDSIGYMYTLPDYRGKGYAYQLTMDIINKTLDSGRLPYIQIVLGNHKSQQLALKAGFVHHGSVEWFGVVKTDGQFKQYIDKYQDLMACPALSVTSLCHLRETFHPLPVTLEDQVLYYQGQAYAFDYIYEDDLYYVKAQMPEDILLSGLMALMKEDYHLCLVNVKSSYLKTIQA